MRPWRCQVYLQKLFRCGLVSVSLPLCFLRVRYAGPKVKKNKHFVTAAVGLDAFALMCADESLQRDKDVVLAAVRRDAVALKFADASLIDDDEILWAALLQRAAALKQPMPEKQLAITDGLAESSAGEGVGGSDAAPDCEILGDAPPSPAEPDVSLVQPRPSFCGICGAMTCVFGFARPAMQSPEAVEAISPSQVDTLQLQVQALRGMSDAQVDAHLADAVGKLRQHRASPVRLLLADRHIGPVQLALAQRALRWGCVVHVDFARGQQHGDSCGYNAAVDVGACLAQSGEGPWWHPETAPWQPHQVSQGEIEAANSFLGIDGGSLARLLLSEEVSRLVARASGKPGPSEVEDFGGVLPWDLALVRIHDAALQAARAGGRREPFLWGGVLNTVRVGGRGSHWFMALLSCRPAAAPRIPPSAGGSIHDKKPDEQDPSATAAAIQESILKKMALLSGEAPSAKKRKQQHDSATPVPIRTRPRGVAGSSALKRPRATRDASVGPWPKRATLAKKKPKLAKKGSVAAA